MTTAYLFALWAGGGNVPPQMALATRLAGAGHEVRVLAPAVLQGQIQAAGLEFEPYRLTPEHDEADPARSLTRDFGYRSPLGAAKATRDHLFVAMAEPVAADVLHVLDRRVDVVVPDYMLMGALFAAEKANVPVAGLIHHTYPFPAPGLPPFGNGWVPRPGLRGAARDAAGRAIFDRVWVRPMLDGLNRARRNLGLESFAEITDLLAVADRFLVLTSRSFDFPAELPANVRYVGPQMDQWDGTPGWSSPWPDDDSRPLDLVSLSTTYQAQESLIRNAIEAVGRLPVRALVTAGPVDVPADQVPPNVHVTRFIPHAHVLPRAAAVITHGGHGTVMAALRHGLPLVCLPMGRDQGDVAARVAWHGAGVRLSARSPASKIALAVERVLGDPAFTAGARRLAAAIAEDEAADGGVHQLVELAARGLDPQVLSDDGRMV